MQFPRFQHCLTQGKDRRSPVFELPMFISHADQCDDDSLPEQLTPEARRSGFTPWERCTLHAPKFHPCRAPRSLKSLNYQVNQYLDFSLSFLIFFFYLLDFISESLKSLEDSCTRPVCFFHLPRTPNLCSALLLCTSTQPIFGVNIWRQETTYTTNAHKLQAMG